MFDHRRRKKVCHFHWKRIHSRGTMFCKMTPILALLVLVIKTVSAEPKGLELSIERTSLFHEYDSPCSQLICHVKGNLDSINSVITRKVKVGENPSDLLSVTPKSPEMHIRVDNIRGNGTLHNNSALIFIDLTSLSTCLSDLVTCEVTYTTRSGLSERTFTLAGPGRLPIFHQDSCSQSQSPITVKGSGQKPTLRVDNSYVSELWFLGEKITKVEAKFATLSDRLEDRQRKSMDNIQSRAGMLENSVLERVSSVETDLSSRVSRLEDRLSSILLDSKSEVSQSLTAMKRRLNQMTVTLDQVNVSSTRSEHGAQREDKPVACERGMGDDVSKTYPRYVMTYDASIEGDVLCETQKDGGGWIVIQRRAFGDVDFYRDWTSYKEGFGELSGDFYMGNEAIHFLTDENPFQLRIDFRINGEESYAEYSSFRIESEANKYRLRLGSYKGTVGAVAATDGLAYSNNRAFTTFDRDNDDHADNCAMLDHGAWWYASCHRSNLNGIWLEKSSDGISWFTGKAWKYPDFTEMKVRRVRPNTKS